MDILEVETVVYRPPDIVFEFLLDFVGYANYSDHLRQVERYGDGTPGTEYELTFTWWKLTYTARSRVTAIEYPHRIDWELLKDINAQGSWIVDEHESHNATTVTFYVEFDAGESDIDGQNINVPRFVSLSWVIARVKPLIQREATHIVREVIADLEGNPREVELTVRTKEE